MSNVMKGADYGTLLTELKTRIHSAQYAALRAVNKELTALYWDIGKLIEERQEAEGWGKAVVERLSAGLRAEFGEKCGFSGRNLWYMRTFYREYKEQPILQPLAAEISWTKNTLILDRCQNPLQREFYLRATARFGWTRRVLEHQIDNQTYEKYLLNQTSFDSALPQAVAAQAKLAVKESLHLRLSRTLRRTRGAGTRNRPDRPCSEIPHRNGAALHLCGQSIPADRGRTSFVRGRATLMA